MGTRSRSTPQFRSRWSVVSPVRMLNRFLGTALVALVLAAPAGAALSDAAVDCIGPAGDPAPDTPAWHLREQANDYCGEQRAYATLANPLSGSSSALLFAGSAGQELADPFRDPAKWNGARGRYDEIN